MYLCVLEQQTLKLTYCAVQSPKYVRLWGTSRTIPNLRVFTVTVCVYNVLLVLFEWLYVLRMYRFMM